MPTFDHYIILLSLNVDRQVHRSPSSSSSTSSIGGGTTNGNNKSATSSISVIPTSSPASAASNNHHHNNTNNGGPAGNPSSVSIDYAHHRGLTISPSMKHVDKPPQPGHPSLYAYQQQQQQHLYHQSLAYHKDAKVCHSTNTMSTLL